MIEGGSTTYPVHGISVGPGDPPGGVDNIGRVILRVMIKEGEIINLELDARTAIGLGFSLEEIGSNMMKSYRKPGVLSRVFRWITQ